jgi:hypothetical protein
MLSFHKLRRLLIRTFRSITPKEMPSSESEGGLGYSRRQPEGLRPEDEFELELKLSHQHRREDDVLRRWLVFPPPFLAEVQVWTKAFAGRMNGERMTVRKLTYSRWGTQWEMVSDKPIKGEEVCGGEFI